MGRRAAGPGRSRRPQAARAGHRRRQRRGVQQAELALLRRDAARWLRRRVGATAHAVRGSRRSNRHGPLPRLLRRRGGTGRRVDLAAAQRVLLPQPGRSPQAAGLRRSDHLHRARQRGPRRREPHRGAGRGRRRTGRRVHRRGRPRHVRRDVRRRALRRPGGLLLRAGRRDRRGDPGHHRRRADRPDRRPDAAVDLRHAAAGPQPDPRAPRTPRTHRRRDQPSAAGSAGGAGPLPHLLGQLERPARQRHRAQRTSSTSSTR